MGQSEVHFYYKKGNFLGRERAALYHMKRFKASILQNVSNLK